MGMAAYLTNAGLTVLNKVMAAQGTLNIVRAELGSGVVTGEAACRARTSLANKICNATFAGAKWANGEAVLSVEYQNAGLATGFFVNEVGIYAMDPTSGNAVLYTYATFGNEPDWIAPSSSAAYSRVYDVTTIIANVASVNVSVASSALVTASDFEATMRKLDTVLLTMETVAQMERRALQSEHDSLAGTVASNYTALDGKIDAKEISLQGEIATALAAAKKYADHGLDNHEAVIQAIITAYDAVIRGLDSRLTVAEAQIAAINT